MAPELLRRIKAGSYLATSAIIILAVISLLEFFGIVPPGTSATAMAVTVPLLGLLVIIPRHYKSYRQNVSDEELSETRYELANFLASTALSVTVGALHLAILLYGLIPKAWVGEWILMPFIFAFLGQPQYRSQGIAEAIRFGSAAFLPYLIIGAGVGLLFGRLRNAKLAITLSWAVLFLLPAIMNCLIPSI